MSDWENCKHSLDFSCLTMKESEFLCGAFPEFTFHFNRCIGTNGRGYRFIFDAGVGVSLDDFKQSVEFVKENIEYVLRYRYHQPTWDQIANDLSAHPELIEFTNEPISFVIETVRDPKIILLYGKTVANGSRTYGITAGGKLVPLSHDAYYVEAPYSKSNYDEVEKYMVLALKEYQTMKSTFPLNFFNKDHESLNIRRDAELKKRFPLGYVDVVVIGGISECSAYVARIVDRKRGVSIDAGGREVKGVKYIVKPGLDYDRLCAEHIRICHLHNEAEEQYYSLIKRANSAIARFRTK